MEYTGIWDSKTYQVYHNDLVFWIWDSKQNIGEVAQEDREMIYIFFHPSTQNVCSTCNGPGYRNKYNMVPDHVSVFLDIISPILNNR